jgi:hypothetical protein
MIRNAREFGWKRAEFMRAQPHVSERAIVQYHVNDGKPVARRGLHFHSMHMHAAVAGDDCNAAVGPRALYADGRRDGPTHRPEIGGRDIGARLVGSPIVAGKGAMRAGIDQHHAIARIDLAQRRDHGCRVNRFR